MRYSDLQSLLDLGTASKEVADPTAGWELCVLQSQEIQQGLGITALKPSLSSVLTQLLFWPPSLWLCSWQYFCHSHLWFALLLLSFTKKGSPKLCWSKFSTLRFSCPHFLGFLSLFFFSPLYSGHAFVYVWVCSFPMHCFTCSGDQK